jgi:hypothetical protein
MTACPTHRIGMSFYSGSGNHVVSHTIFDVTSASQSILCSHVVSPNSELSEHPWQTPKITVRCKLMFDRITELNNCPMTTI